MTDLKQRILPTVQNPARYTGGEWGEIQKNIKDGHLNLYLDDIQYIFYSFRIF